MCTVALRKAHIEDYKIIHENQTIAFKPLLDHYKDYDTNPGMETTEKVREEIGQQHNDYYHILIEDSLIGMIRIRRKDNGVRRISRMYIMPDYQNKGYAQTAITLAESLYPEAKIWELDTILQETKLCHLYEKMGYKRTGEVIPVNVDMSLVSYQKPQHIE